MAPPRFTVGYIDPPMYDSFRQLLAGRDDIALLRLGDQATPAAVLLERLRDCDGYYVSANRDELPAALHVSRQLLAGLPRLKVVATYGAGYDTVDVPACSDAGVAVVNQAGGNARAVAEHAVAMAMALLKRIPEAHAALLGGMHGPRERLMGRELAGRPVGIVGLGHIGRCSAAIFRALGCTVLACDPYMDAAACAQHGARKAGLDELLAASDVVTLHCPLTVETRGLFDAARFAAMRPGAVFVNTARGSTYDEVALKAALDSGHLAGAGLDVWAREPPAADHPLLVHPAVLASPHTAGVTHESRDRVARLAAQVFVEAAAGRLPARCLNPEVAPRLRPRLAEQA